MYMSPVILRLRFAHLLGWFYLLQSISTRPTPISQQSKQPGDPLETKRKPTAEAVDSLLIHLALFDISRVGTDPFWEELEICDFRFRPGQPMVVFVKGPYSSKRVTVYL